MSRYITELSIPNDMDFHCQVEDLIKQGHKEYSFTRFTFYDDSEKYPLGLFPNGGAAATLDNPSYFPRGAPALTASLG